MCGCAGVWVGGCVGVWVRAWVCVRACVWVCGCVWAYLPLTWVTVPPTSRPLRFAALEAWEVQYRRRVPGVRRRVRREGEMERGWRRGV